jgi:hypothetical protein
LESDGSEALPTEIRIVLAALRHIVLSGEKPTAQEVAEQVGFGGRALRAALHKKRRPSLRSLVTYTGVLYAKCLISQGVKRCAAVRLAGLHSRWNYNRRVKWILEHEPPVKWAETGVQMLAEALGLEISNATSLLAPQGPETTSHRLD